MAKREYPSANLVGYRSSRNPYASKIADLSSLTAIGARQRILADYDTEKQKGQWREYFGAEARAGLQVELGAYHGETANALAQRCPEDIICALEWKFKQCYRGAKKSADQGITNNCFLRANMARLPWIFAPGEIDRIWMLFPDPWAEKERHQKWRILQPDFIRMLAWLLPAGKEFIIKTDHAEYAEFIRGALAEVGAFTDMPEEKAETIFSLIPPTPFEKIFLRQGLAIHRFALIRNEKKIEVPLAWQKQISKEQPNI